MSIPNSTIMCIINNIEEGKFICVKCEDDSELFLHKEFGMYNVSSVKSFDKDVSSYPDTDAIADLLDNIRGWMVMRPMACGCD